MKYYKALIQINNEFTYCNYFNTKYLEPIEVMLTDARVGGYRIRDKYNKQLNWYPGEKGVLSNYSSGKSGFTVIMMKEIEKPE